MGASLTGFVAPDVRRDVEIVEASEVDEGFVTAKIRTWNVLRTTKAGADAPAFAAARRVAIAELWTWTGEPWGGSVPDDDISLAKPDA